MSSPLALFSRCLWDESELILVVGRVAPLLESRRIYESRHHIAEPEQDLSEARDRMLAACGLAAVSLADRESWGWSLSFPGSAHGFFCGVEPEGMLCSLVKPSSKDMASAVVQRQKPDSPLTQSHFTPQTDDPVRAVERYFHECEQAPVRIELHDDFAVFARPLPGGSLNALAAFSPQEFVERCRTLVESGAARKLQDVVLFYECRCNDEMILDMITRLPASQQRELWGDQLSLHIQCPRCGRTYMLHRAGRG